MLEHRRQARDLMSVIRAVVRRTSQSSSSVEDYAAHLEGRLGALSRIQEILLRELQLDVDAGPPGVDLAELVSSAFVADAIPPRQLVISGPGVRVPGRAAASLALAFHELTANAIKFGALGNPDGRLSVLWNADANDQIRLEWQESGVAMMSEAPRPSGFGTELIERTLPYEIGARTALNFNPGGLQCLIEFSGCLPNGLAHEVKP